MYERVSVVSGDPISDLRYFSSYNASLKGINVNTVFIPYVQ